MLGLKKFFKSGTAAPLPADVLAALEGWRASEAPPTDDLHFHVRYVIVDIVTTGMNAEKDELLGISAVAVRQQSILSNDALSIDFGVAGDDPSAVDRQLMALLKFIAKAPMVCYHVPYVGSFLQRVYKERFGLDFQPQWVDLAWLLPSLFEDKAHSVMPLDHWIEVLGLDGGSGRRESMDNVLLLARLFQMLLVRAAGKQVDTAASLIDESRASSFLRRAY